MQYRQLGDTGLTVSEIGLGCVQLGSSTTDYAVEIVRRALALGVTYFDVARGYGDAEIKVGLGVAGHREQVVLSTKTGGRTRADAWTQLHESLERLGTAYVDNIHLHALRSQADIDRRLGPGGALEALLAAKAQGLTRMIGCTSHRSDLLIAALKRFHFDIIMVPMNLVEREPLAALIPLCQEKGVAVTIMKPLATGLLPASLALKWLRNQPIACAVPGVTTLAELEENIRVSQPDASLHPEEIAQAQALAAAWAHQRCRICNRCQPCPQGIPLAITLGTDVMYDHYRTMGSEDFRDFPWSRAAIERDLPRRQERIAAIESCTRCGLCEERCPYGLPIMAMLQGLLPAMRDMVHIYETLLSGS